jgi:hypothetical protein
MWAAKLQRATKTMLVLATILLLTNTGTPVATALPGFAKAAKGSESPFTPYGFELQGSNGYTIFVFGIPAFRGRGATVEISVQRGRAHVTYLAPATVTETSIQANLGELGEISASFHPNGQTKTFHLQCSKQSFSFESGSYEGKIDFHGEEGYTEIETTSAPSAISLFSICFTVSRSGGGRTWPGAELYLRTPGLGPAFGVVKHRPSATAHFYVSVAEYRSGISIKRFTTLRMPAGSFLYSHGLRKAMVHPPAPFSGSASYDRHRRANRRWQGDLAVDLPGKSDVPLTGRQFRAYLLPH